MSKTWQCPQCREVIDGDFAKCWQCGASIDGTTDPNFEHADNYFPDTPEPQRQISLWNAFQVITGVCIISALLGFALSNHRSPFWWLMLLFHLLLAAIVLLHTFSWAALNLVYRAHRSWREEQAVLRRSEMNEGHVIASSHSPRKQE